MVLDGGLPPWKTGGIETYVQKTGEALVQAGHEVEVFTPLERGNENGYPFEVTPVSPGGDLWAGYLSAMRVYPTIYRRLLQALRKRINRHFDVIYAHNPFMSGRAGGKVAQETGVPALLHYHFSHTATLFLAGKKKSLEERLARFGIGGFQRYSVNNNSTRKALSSRFGIDENRIEVMPLFVDTSEFHPFVKCAWVREKFAIPSEVPLVLFVGRIEKIKRLDVLLQAMSQVMREEQCHLLIGGAGSLLEEMKRLAERLGISRVVSFAGAVPREELPAFYCASDIVAYPGLDECYSLVVLEAASCGKAIVATDHPIMLEEFADGGRAALSHKRSDAESLAMCIRTLIREPVKSRQMGEFARQKVEAKHSIGAHIEGLVDLWEKMKHGTREFSA